MWMKYNLTICMAAILNVNTCLSCVRSGTEAEAFRKLLGTFREQYGRFHLTSLKFKLQNYWSSRYHTLIMYKSSWRLISIQIVVRNGLLVLCWIACSRLSVSEDDRKSERVTSGISGERDPEEKGRGPANRPRLHCQRAWNRLCDRLLLIF